MHANLIFKNDMFSTALFSFDDMLLQFPFLSFTWESKKHNKYVASFEAFGPYEILCMSGNMYAQNLMCSSFLFLSQPKRQIIHCMYVFFFVQVHVILLSVLSTPNDPQLIITNSNYKFAIFWIWKQAAKTGVHEFFQL